MGWGGGGIGVGGEGGEGTIPNAYIVPTRKISAPKVGRDESRFNVAFMVMVVEGKIN